MSISMKKRVGSLLLVCVMLFVFAGCGFAPKTPSEPTLSEPVTAGAVFLSANREDAAAVTLTSASAVHTGNAAKLAIRAIISKLKHEESYGELRQDLAKTDPGDTPGTVRLFYDGKEVSATWDGKTWNREHVWPCSKSWFKRGSSERGASGDLHHIRPDSPSGNSSRGNKSFGESSGYYNPPDNVKGDIARILFYMLTRYSQTDSQHPVTKVAQSMEMLLRWNKLDPVDEHEIVRNNEAYGIQGNRNPFIDCPELADTIWGDAA